MVNDGDYSRAQVAQEFYQAWLRTTGIDDPQARIALNPHLGYVGIIGQDRAAREKRVYDILPGNLLIEINRRADNLKPLDPTLVERLKAVIH